MLVFSFLLFSSEWYKYYNFPQFPIDFSFHRTNIILEKQKGNYSNLLRSDGVRSWLCSVCINNQYLWTIFMRFLSFSSEENVVDNTADTYWSGGGSGSQFESSGTGSCYYTPTIDNNKRNVLYKGWFPFRFSLIKFYIFFILVLFFSICFIFPQFVVNRFAVMCDNKNQKRRWKWCEGRPLLSYYIID